MLAQLKSLRAFGLNAREDACAPGACRRSSAAAPKTRQKRASGATRGREPAFLSDLISFQSESEENQEQDAAFERGDQAGTAAADVVDRASSALERARQALEEQKEQNPSRPTGSIFTYKSGRADLRGSSGGQAPASAPPASPGERFERPFAVAERGPQEPTDSGVGRTEVRQGSSQEAPVPQRAAPTSTIRKPLELADRQTEALNLLSQDAQDAEAARGAVLPPFQSVEELTSAAAPPERGGEPVPVGASVASRVLADGEGELADGTRFKRESGETKGKNGHWFRWTKLSGLSPAGQVEWQERSWEASDWAGVKELGAEKSGCRADGSAWRETWREAIGFDEGSGEPMVERTAHKWAKDAQGDEWEEKWGEHYWSKGRAHKWADKWGKEGPEVWHERWGEDYPRADACFKFTDKWAERRAADGSLEAWGDKWEEDFAGGKGGKKGETWSVDGAGQRYQRWWGERHLGEGRVQKFGNSSTGEHWDVEEQMDTYYNPIPHFDFRLALDHSPTLKAVPTLPRAGDDLGDGIGNL